REYYTMHGRDSVDRGRRQRWGRLSGFGGNGTTVVRESTRLAGGPTGDAHERPADRICEQGRPVWVILDRPPVRRCRVDAWRFVSTHAFYRADRFAWNGVAAMRDEGWGMRDEVKGGAAHPSSPHPPSLFPARRLLRFAVNARCE